ncbi:MAG: protein translocase subunit SecF [Friedmanniella sp.]
MSRFGQLGHRLYTGEISYDFLAQRRRWYSISAVLILVSLSALMFRGLDFGIEFKGGADFRAPTTVTAQTIDQMHVALDKSGVPNVQNATINTIGSDQVRVQTRTLDPTTEVPKLRAAIGQEVGVPTDQVAYNLIGASWGGQITERALIALGVFLVLVGLMIWIYFRDGAMSGAALVALVHDLILTIGIYALVGFTVTPATLIGVLTILGYSLYDTVVVFDKVRENVRDLKGSTTRTYSEAANLAVNQVLVRSINTTVIGVLPVAALLIAGAAILGEGPLKDLALALFVGMVSGAYSSIFIATPLLAQIKERDPEMQKLASRVASRRAKEAPRNRSNVLQPATAGGGGDPDPSDDATEEESFAEEGERPLPALTVTRAAAGNVPVRPVTEGAAKRPQPQHKPRSQRRS